MTKLPDEEGKKLLKYLKQHNKTHKELNRFLLCYKKYKLTSKYLKEIFLNYFPPKSGYTKEILMSDLVNIHPSFKTENGGTWCRSNTSPLGKDYIILRKLKSGSIYSIKLDGYNKQKTEAHRSVSSKISKAIIDRKCVVLQIGTNIEVDHKNGKYNDRSLESTDTQKISDFQAMSKAVNDAKRQHCKECKKSGKRFNATRLGYKESYTMGDETSQNCDGCYWYDPYDFNSTISKDFKKQY